MAPTHFSTDLQQELQSALDLYIASHGAPAADERLRAATVRICHEAHALKMTPEGMVIALRQFYGGAGSHGLAVQTPRRAAYNRLLSVCIHAYFEAAEKGTPE